MNANSFNSLSTRRCGFAMGAALLVCASACFEPAAMAQDDEPAPDTSLEFTLTPGVWLCRLRGDSTLGPAPAVSLDKTLQLENHEPAFNFEAAVLRGEQWKLDISGFYFETESRGTIHADAEFGNASLVDGDAFEASFQMVSVAVQFGAWLWQPYCIGTNEDGTECRVAVRAGPVIGLRDVYVEQHVESALGGSDSASGEWLIPFAGLQLEIRYNLPDTAPLLRSFTVDGGASIGPALGGDGGWMTQLHAGITGYFSQNFAVGFGYRLLELNAENGDYEFNGGLQGLFLYAAVRF